MFQQDLQNADCILIMGSNMAECHPVGFRWVMKARERGAAIIHVDPRFTRTSAMSNQHVAIRSGSDIAFLGGLVNYIIEHDRWFKEYVLAYTNASTIVGADFKDTEELDGLFSGFDPAKRQYTQTSWGYDGTQAPPPAPGSPTNHNGLPAPPKPAVDFQVRPPHTDPTLAHPRCVFQILKRHYARYTPDMVSRVCGCSAEEFERVAKTLCDNSGRERTSSICYAVGWTQHTTGVQYIRTASIVQALLGNMGRPGGGILALRGHASIQGSTDVPTLYHLLPGYLPSPSAAAPQHDTLDGWVANTMPTTGWWANGRKYMVSLLKMWYGDAATPDNQWGYEYLPKSVGDHSHIPMFKAMSDDVVKGFMCIGQNPAGGGQNAIYNRAAMAHLDWFVVRDLFRIETAEFWKAPDISDPSVIDTEVFFLPSTSVTESEGSFTNTQRMLQWHDKGAEPTDDCRSDLWFTHHLYKRLRKLYEGSSDPKDAAFLAMTWNLDVDGPMQEPKAVDVLAEINGWTTADRVPVKTFLDLKDDGSTSCGVWIYTGVAPTPGVNLARARVADAYTSLGWGFAWPANRRTLYNRASADPEGKPWSERKRYVWWDETQKKWVGYDVPDYPATKAPSSKGDWAKGGMDALDGSTAFIMQRDGKAWLFAPSGIVDGPLPAHYEPWETGVKNPLYGTQRNPVTKVWNMVGNRYIDAGDPNFPIIITTYRLTEHHLSGPMSRWSPWLTELQPEMFIEISPELAAERGIENVAWCTVYTPRAAIECKALVTRRLKPFTIAGQRIHQAGAPFHWSWAGVVTGGNANDLIALVADPNVTIHEGKAFMCQIVAGRKQAEILATLPDQTRPLPLVGRREKRAAESAVDEGIELAERVGRYLPLDHPEGVYHG
jgi:formate dehydrogenase major subunit